MGIEESKGEKGMKRVIKLLSGGFRFGCGCFERVL